MPQRRSVRIRRKYIISLNEDLQLKELSKTLGMSESEFVRSAIRELYDDVQKGVTKIKFDSTWLGRTKTKHIGLSEPDDDKLKYVCKRGETFYAVGIRTALYRYAHKKLKFDMKA